MIINLNHLTTDRICPDHIRVLLTFTSEYFSLKANGFIPQVAATNNDPGQSRSLLKKDISQAKPKAKYQAKKRVTKQPEIVWVRQLAEKIQIRATCRPGHITICTVRGLVIIDLRMLHQCFGQLTSALRRNWLLAIDERRLWQIISDPSFLGTESWLSSRGYFYSTEDLPG